MRSIANRSGGAITSTIGSLRCVGEEALATFHLYDHVVALGDDLDRGAAGRQPTPIRSALRDLLAPLLGAPIADGVA